MKTLALFLVSILSFNRCEAQLLNLLNTPVQLTATNPVIDITNGLAAAYKFYGDLSDWSGNGYDATTGGTMSYTTGQDLVSNHALSLNSSSTANYAVGTTMGSFGSTMSSGFAVTGWEKIPYNGSFQAIFGSTKAGDVVFTFYISYANAVQEGGAELVVIDALGHNHVYDISGSLIDDGNWHFFAISCNPSVGDAFIYVDNTSYPITFPAFGATYVLTGNLVENMGIGWRNGSGYDDGYMTGNLQDLRFYGRELATNEITTLFNNKPKPH